MDRHAVDARGLRSASVRPRVDHSTGGAGHGNVARHDCGTGPGFAVDEP